MKLVTNIMADIEGEDYLVGDPDGEPFAVVFRDAEGVAAVKVLVFAASKVDAVERVQRAISLLREEYRGQHEHLEELRDSRAYYPRNKARRCDDILAMPTFVEAFDKRYLGTLPTGQERLV